MDLSQQWEHVGLAFPAGDGGCDEQLGGPNGLFSGVLSCCWFGFCCVVLCCRGLGCRSLACLCCHIGSCGGMTGCVDVGPCNCVGGWCSVGLCVVGCEY